MTLRSTMTTTSGSRTTGHQLFANAATPTYSAASPKYIGLRVSRYGPPVTSAAAGRFGTSVVRARRNVATAPSASPANATRPAAAAAVRAGDPAAVIGSGR